MNPLDVSDTMRRIHAGTQAFAAFPPAVGAIVDDLEQISTIAVAGAALFAKLHADVKELQAKIAAMAAVV
jgi:hypothetical protein